MERLLPNADRLVMAALVGILFALAGLYTLVGVGMRMSALEMTSMGGMRDMPGDATPGSAGAPGTRCSSS